MYKTMKQLENKGSIMAIQETRTLPAPFIETLGRRLCKTTNRLTADPIDTSVAPTMYHKINYKQKRLNKH